MPKKHGKGTDQPRDQQNTEKAQFDTIMIKCLDLADKIGNDTRLPRYYDIRGLYCNMQRTLGLGFEEEEKQSHPYDVCTEILVLMSPIHVTLGRVGDKGVRTFWKAEVDLLESELTSFMVIIGKPAHLSYSSPGSPDLVTDHVMEALKIR
jgi:hypothetical protein